MADKEDRRKILHAESGRIPAPFQYRDQDELSG